MIFHIPFFIPFKHQRKKGVLAGPVNYLLSIYLNIFIANGHLQTIFNL
jgi:hypothetical protein